MKGKIFHTNSRRQYLKQLGVPLHYRLRLTNWLMAEPWKIMGSRRWHYRTMYRAERDEHRITLSSGREYCDPSYGIVQSLWRTVTFPHVHHHLED